MRVTLEGGLELDNDLQPVDLSLPLTFEGPAFTAFGLPRATRRRVFDTNEAGDRGCRCDEITFCVHTHTTHIESCAHVQHHAAPLPAQLLALPPLLLTLLVDATRPADLDDALLQLQRSFPDISPQAVLLCTGTTAASACGARPGFRALSVESVQRLLSALPDLKVLLVDSISIDPEDDGGLLLAHRAFFLGDPARFVVEMCCVPPGVGPGLYALAINAAAFDSDAAPCRPVLYHLKNRQTN